MRTTILAWLLWLGVGAADGGAPARSSPLQVGLYGDDARAVACVTGPAGTVLRQVAWAWVPDDLGLAYVTLRLDVPPNLEPRGHPAFDAAVTRWIVADYPDGTVEWTLLFAGCPSGWIRLWTREFAPLDNLPARFGIRAEHSMIRDCAFVLNEVEVLNELSVNDPRCGLAPADGRTWGVLKRRYR